MTRLRSWILPSGAKKNRLLRRVALIKGWQLAEVVSHGFKEEIRRKRYSTGCRSIRYFDEESEDAWKITPFQVYAACIGIGTFFYLVNQGVISWIMGLF